MRLTDDRIAYGMDLARAARGGILLHRDLLSGGLSAAAIQRLVSDGSLVRLRRGAYTTPDAAADRDDRYRLFVLASMALGDVDRVAALWSAAALHRLPLIGAWPLKLHIIDPRASGGSSSPNVVLHRSRSGTLDFRSIDGCRATTLSRTIADMCRVLAFAPAVAMVDEALRRGLSTTTLLDELDGMNARYGNRAARASIEFGDARAANAGESLSRARIHELGYAAPELQVRFIDTRGRQCDVDFFWPTVRKIGEFDGVHKYTRAEYTGGRPAAEVVVREKQREDALRPLVSSFDRWLWDDAISPARFDRFLRERGVPRARRR